MSPNVTVTVTRNNTETENTLRNANGNGSGNTVTLDLRVSCDTFWKYQMNFTVNRDEYHDPDIDNNMNMNINGCCNEKKTATFSRLERDLCDAMIAHIHEDLLLNRQEEQIKVLVEVSNKFHIHGHTTRSLLYHQSNAPHADHGGLIYICSHC
jgi:hypothetical protein